MFAGDVLDQLGDLPRSSGGDVIFLIAQDPHWLFTYWDFDISKHPGGPMFLRYCDAAGNVEGEIEVQFEARNWYIPVKHAGAQYYVELGCHRGGNWVSLGRSASVQTPPDQLSPAGSFTYATMPLQISFDRMLENVRGSLRDGEDLMDAMARLQHEGGANTLSALGARDWEEARRMIIEALLGRETLEELDSGTLSSAEVGRLMEEKLRERLGSEASSPLMGGRWTEAAGLFSGAPTPAGIAALSSWAAATFSSFAAAAAQSSWGGSEIGAWAKESLTSWMQSALSSWSEAALSSWGQSALSSWTQAAVSSWGGASAAASWSTPPSREFFLHVNAEVIFYGGTHPDAGVTVNGEPISLLPDGTFHYHFKFPDGDFEIPIVATSPDGKETRSATLSFRRETQRTGDVGASAQSPVLPPLTGKK